MSCSSGWTPRVTALFTASLAVVFLLSTHAAISHAQATDPLAQQWADKRVELERLVFLRRSWQISDSEFRERTGAVNTEVRDLGVQIGKVPRDRQAQIRQQSDSV